MKFVVRYWSSLFPRQSRLPAGQPPWVTYSVHPPSKLGLHNAMLVVHDRLEILADYGGDYDSAVFMVEDDKMERLAPETAAALFAALPHGEIKWLDIGRCLLPPQSAATAPADLAPPAMQQLPLFAHTHTPYDDLDPIPHALDLDAR